MNGPPVSLSGDALLSGYYANELLLKLMHRHDPQPEIFAMYGRTVQRLTGLVEPAALLRRYEMELLGLLGYALSLDHDGLQQQDLEPQQYYEYRAEQGAVPSSLTTGAMLFRGDELLAIRAQEFHEPTTLRAANRLMRGVIAYHLDGKELQSRKVLRELRNKSAGLRRDDIDEEMKND